MHVLVIGGTRFVGYLLVWRLLAAGHRVTTFNRGTLADPFGDRVERLRGDRTTADLARLLSGRAFDAAVDFAAYQPRDVEAVVDVLAGHVGHYVFISTGQVYLVREASAGPEGWREDDYDGTTMAEPTDPSEHEEWAYGMGKRGCEGALLEAAARRRFPSTRLRIPMVNGARDHYRRIERYLVRLLDGGPVLLPDGGARPVRHVYGDDVAAAIVAVLGDARALGGAFNLAHDETPTLRDVVEILRALVGSRSALVPIDAATLRANAIEPAEISPFSGRWMSFLDPSRARDALAFRPTPLREALGRIVAAYVGHPPSDAPPGLQHRPTELRLARASG